MLNEIPRFGLGTFRVDAEKTASSVESALKAGYRHIDTAAFYKNEAAVGNGVRAAAAAGVPREDIWITSKVWWEFLSHDALIEAVKESHAKLNVGPIDLMLAHWPSPQGKVPIAETLAAFGAVQEMGLIRHYGVSNFTAPLLQEAVAAPGGNKIYMNQIEVSPFFANRALVDATRGLGVKVTGYMPLGEGRAHHDDTLKAIGEKHGVSPAQVTFAWLLSRDIVAISASTNPAHQKSNFDAQSVKLDAEDIRRIDALDEGQRHANPPFAPAW